MDENLLADVEADSSLGKLRRERDAANKRADQTQDLVEDLTRRLAILTDLQPDPPKWLTPKKPKRQHHAIIGAPLSDCHFDEVVRPEEVGGINKYDRDIATLRLQRWAEQVIAQSRDYLSGLNFDGAFVPILGDVFSGNLHDLAETNVDTLFGSLLYWSEQIAAALELIAGHFGKVHVPVVVGNHGRLTRKPRTKLRARDNTDWLLGHMLAKHFKGSSVTVQVDDDADAFADVYDTTFLLTHGDQVTGGGGIGGIWPPIMRLLARKRTRYAHRPFDLAVMGHWHQLIQAPSQGLIVNGSTKGYDEFAAMMNFAPERPQQALLVVTPERGVTWTGSVHCDDRAAEGW